MQQDSANVLAHVLFDEDLPQTAAVFCHASGLQQLVHPVEPLLLESWSSEKSITRGVLNSIIYAHDDQVLFGCVKLHHKLALDDMTAAAYREVFAVLDELGFPCLIRVWHYLPYLNRKEKLASRYQLFCQGRHKAFAASSNMASGQYCAATVIGTRAKYSTMFFIAARQPGRPIVNVHQVEPWQYPGIEAAARPLFSRALWSHELATLFISGTASIVEHHSVHEYDSAAQLQQIFAHFNVLITQCAQQTSILLNRFDSLKIYVRRNVETDVMRRVIAACLSAHDWHADQTVFLAGEVCRPELAVEAEAVLSVRN